MDKKLGHLIEFIPIIKSIIHDDVAINITSKNECIYVLNGEKVKSPLEKGIISNDKMGGLSQVLKEKKIINKVLNKENDGMDVLITVIPIIENSKVIGSLGVVKNIENKVEIEKTSEELMHSLEETSKLINELSNNAIELSNKLNIIASKTEETEKNIEESSDIIKLIEDISRKSNILGLNASIESARAGEYGKGFSVVANEMRKLALVSGQSSKKVSDSLKQMNNGMNVIVEAINELEKVSTDQAKSTEEILDAMKKITSNSKVLLNNVKNN
ncbi:chemotaxis protein [Clostridium sp. P21]|uniref:Chemotaxis protein n=1 Tax=Clostridium muellerianum TaxID=2716538 RepID=A0A7Y0EJL1_9CLOT|nr:methyl-accepting chemotaxis protein [Clostridium muellerianum]NMM64596.1 chemotaxis protein [Clostridium muellerianum]